AGLSRRAAGCPSTVSSARCASTRTRSTGFSRRGLPRGGAGMVAGSVEAGASGMAISGWGRAEAPMLAPAGSPRQRGSACDLHRAGRRARIPLLCSTLNNARRSSGSPEPARPGTRPESFQMKTFTAKSETVQRDWYLVDATGKTLGRLSSELARRLRGKHKPVYTPHVDTGDYLVVINAEKIVVTGKKLTDKLYHRFTGHINNLKTKSLTQA